MRGTSRRLLDMTLAPTEHYAGSRRYRYDPPMTRSHESLWLTACGVFIAVAVALFSADVALYAIPGRHYSFWSGGLMIGAYVVTAAAIFGFVAAVRGWPMPLAGDRPRSRSAVPRAGRPSVSTTTQVDALPSLKEDGDKDTEAPFSAEGLGAIGSPNVQEDSYVNSMMIPGTGQILPRPISIEPRLTVSRPVRISPRPEHLAGREELLRGLDTRLAIDDTARPRIVVLHGLGGAGKTSLAVEYAYRHMDECSVVWQLPAENSTVLSSAFAELARQLGAADALGQTDPVSQVHSIIAAGSEEWLLIFENAPDPAAVSSALPPTGHVRLLITSRNPQWPGQALEVPVLERQPAAEFLMARTGDPDRRAASDLAHELGGLPLALEQAAAYLTATGGSLAAYLTLFRERRADLLARGDAAGYDRRVATTWLVSFERLQEDYPDAISLLRLLSCYAPEEIPVNLLLRQPVKIVESLGPIGPTLGPLLEDPIAADDAIVALRRYSLVSRLERDARSVHRLVQAVTIDRMSAEEAKAWRLAAGQVIIGILPDDPFMTTNFSVYAKVLPHGMKALALQSPAIEKFALYLAASGSHASALDLEQQHLDACEQALGADDPSVLIAETNIAFMTELTGDSAAACGQYESLLPTLRQVFGAGNPQVLVARANVARIKGMTGDPAGARDQYKSLLPEFERTLGPESHSALTARAHLARLTGEAGDPASARDQYAALLPVQRRVLGPDHLNTLTTRANLARYTGNAGDDVSARDQFSALVPDLERLLGPEHRETLVNRANLAFVTGVKNPGRARNQYAALLPIEERILGPEDPDTLIARDNLARLTGEAGNPVGARVMYSALLKDFERIYGAEDPKTKKIRLALANWATRAHIQL